MKPFITTYTGRQVHILDPDPSEIYIKDVAHALSQQCRFAGHTKDFYSVAQHSVLVSRLVPLSCALWGLLHDASEAYLCDIPSPLKDGLPDYCAVEERMQRAIAKRFNLPWPMPDEVHTVDKAIVTDEACELFHAIPEWTREQPRTGVLVTPWAPRKAEALFLTRYLELMTSLAA